MDLDSRHPHTTSGRSVRARCRPGGLALLCALVAALAGTTPASARVIASLGSGAGQVDDPEGVAVDQSTGVVYVGDGNNFRIDEFTRGGSFVRAFGFGVRDGAEKLEVCTTETTCQEGSTGGLGEAPGVVEPDGIAVDSATHDVYVSNPVQKRVEEYTEAGAFVTMFGDGVDKGPVHPGNVCSATFIKEGDQCGMGTSSTEPGGFGQEGDRPLSLPLAIDGSGDVWVGDQNRLEKFSAAGVFLEELGLPGAGRLEALGVDTLGNFYILDSAEEAILKLDEKGMKSFAVDGPPGVPRTLTLGGANGLYVGDEGPPYHLIQYNATNGDEEEVFGVGSIPGEPNGHVHEGEDGQEWGDVLAFDDKDGEIFVVSSETGSASAVAALAVPAPGPLQRASAAEAVRGTRAKLTAVLDAEGAETEYQFQYVDDATFKAEAKGHEFDHASTSPLRKLAAGFTETPITVQIEGLSSETLYHFRLLAHNANGSVQTAEGAPEEGTFETTGAVEVDEAYVTEATTDAATLNASMNPEGVASSFHFEYLSGSAYQANVEGGRAPFAGAAVAPVPDGSLGAGETAVAVAQTVAGLAPDTTYMYRVVGSNAGGAGASAAKSFTTRTPAEATLPDGREWELVSPPEKHGGLFDPLDETNPGVTQAAEDGEAITYLATRPTEALPQGYPIKEQVLSQRTPEGWVSRDLSLPHETAPGLSLGEGDEYRFFSEDLSAGIAQPIGAFDPAVSEEASEDTPLLRDTAVGGGYQPLLIGCPPSGQECRPAVESHADVPSGTRFGISIKTLEPCSTPTVTGFCGVQFVGASPDGRHVILDSPVVGLTATSGDHGGLYEWSEGRLTLVSRLPSNAPATFEHGQEPQLGRLAGPKGATASSAVTGDGSRVDWTFKGHLYQRDLATERTVQIDAPGAGAGLQQADTQPEFQAASADGKVIFFTDEQKLLKVANPGAGRPDLYRCVIVEAPSPKCELSDLTPGADVQGALLGSSTDGTYAYFLADGVLAPGAEPGHCENKGYFEPGVECNLYEWHEGTTRFIAALSGEDEPDWSGSNEFNTARVSPNGQWLEFMSKRSLTGYENTDAHSGEPDEEVFLYDAAADGGTGSLVCASCNPTGQRPTGAEYGEQQTLSGGSRIWQNTTWIAANVPAWTNYSSGAGALHQPRYLSNSGRLFFDSRDDLSVADTNSAEDVYEFEPSGVGGCASTSAAFAPANGGCVSLISSGTSPSESAFLDASESGGDVFFLTAAKLSESDRDSAVDVYDAHECTTASPCIPAKASSAAGCEGEACQVPAPAPSEVTPASLTFSGAGNFLQSPPSVSPPAKPRALTRAQKLAAALKACRKKARGKRRTRCERQARRAYGAARPGKSSSSSRKRANS